MSRERAQALVEATIAVPACVACALVIVDAGTVVRDRIATSQAATRAAEAQLAGADALAAARTALPVTLRSDVRVDRRGDDLVVRTTSRGLLATVSRRAVTHRSDVSLTEVSR